MDKVIIGGGMMFTFLKAMGYEIGSSLVEMEMLDTARTIMTHAREKGVKFYLPVDCVVANQFSPDAEIKIVPVQEIPPAGRGTSGRPRCASSPRRCRTRGPSCGTGRWASSRWSRSPRTFFLAHTVAASYALTIIGGGDTDVAVNRAGEPRTCRTSPPAAAPRCSCSRASRCPGSNLERPQVGGGR